MLFNSLDYLIFLVLALAGFWALRHFGIERDVYEGADANAGRPARRLVVRRSWLRLFFLSYASFVFYMGWNPYYIGLMLFSTILDFFTGSRIGASEDPGVRKFWLIVSIVGNLGLLCTFKYFNFFSDTTEQALALAGVHADIPVLRLALPVGISFYTFETLSYAIDVYYRRLEPERDFLRFAYFVAFFPHLVAGPIIRAAEFLPQVHRPPWLTRERVSGALFLIGLGLAKKIIFADYIAVNLVDRVFANPTLYSSVEVVLGLYGFTLLIYADFSGYTDVARGSARLFGIELPENFDRPYQATSVAEFWRRWHMTLSTWLRDYVYFPLGGSKKGEARTYLNLWITIFLIGLWHGGGTGESSGLWNFVIYGNLQAFAVMGNRVFDRLRKRWGWTAPDPIWLVVIQIVVTLQFVVFSRILFRASSPSNAWAVFDQLFDGTSSVAQIDADVWRILVLGFYLHYVPRSQLEWLRARFVSLPAFAQGLALALIGAILVLFVTSEVVPFIYFQF